MYFDSPCAALTAAARVLKPGDAMVAALWAEPERVEYFTLPRRLLSKYTSLPRVDLGMPGPFKYAHLERIQRDFAYAGLNVDHVEEQNATVVEAQDAQELAEWVRDFGLERILCRLPIEVQAAWEDDLAQEVTALIGNGTLRLGGTTRIVVARKAS